MGGAEGMEGSFGHGAFWEGGGGDLDGGERTQDGFGARQEGGGFVEGNSVVEVDREGAAEVDL